MRSDPLSIKDGSCEIVKCPNFLNSCRAFDEAVVVDVVTSMQTPVTFDGDDSYAASTQQSASFEEQRVSRSWTRHRPNEFQPKYVRRLTLVLKRCAYVKPTEESSELRSCRSD